MASVYEELRKKESTSEWKTELLNMIKKAYEENGKTFDENMIPEDLRNIYEKWILMPEIEEAKDFWKLTLEFVEKIWWMFVNQTEKLIKEV
jgi:hypothetical protein